MTERDASHSPLERIIVCAEGLVNELARHLISLVGLPTATTLLGRATLGTTFEQTPAHPIGFAFEAFWKTSAGKGLRTENEDVVAAFQALYHNLYRELTLAVGDEMAEGWLRHAYERMRSHNGGAAMCLRLIAPPRVLGAEAADAEKPEIEKLRELDRIKSEFVSVAAHQLRTPLTGIRWSFQALLDESLGPLNASQWKVANEGLKVTLRAIRLVTNLLNVARIEGGRFGFSFRREPFMAVLDTVLPRAKELAEKKGIVIRWSIPATSVALPVDLESLTMAFDNIFDNAVKYTPPGGSVDCTATYGEDHLTVTVADTGIGIPERDRSKLFTKFFRGSNALLLQTHGSGLGLYIAKLIIEHHGGSLAVENREGGGTIASVKLPIRREAAESGRKLNRGEV